MNLSLFFRRAAQAEFDDSAAWYESQRSGLGAEFVSEVQSVFNAIVTQPDRFPIVAGDVREAMVRRFPFCVYYRVKPQQIVILAVFHSLRDPAIWQSRG